MISRTVKIVIGGLFVLSEGNEILDRLSAVKLKLALLLHLQYLLVSLTKLAGESGRLSAPRTIEHRIFQQTDKIPYFFEVYTLRSAAMIGIVTAHFDLLKVRDNFLLV
jgi:hypothetical protein